MKPRYIYFDKRTGFITDILGKRKRGRASYVVSDSETMQPFIMGTRGMNEILVGYDREQEKYVLLNRDNIIKLRYYGKNLYRIPKRTIPDYDLRIDLFSEGNVLEVAIDPSRISTMYATEYRKDIVFEKGIEIYRGNKRIKILLYIQFLLEASSE